MGKEPVEHHRPGLVLGERGPQGASDKLAAPAGNRQGDLVLSPRQQRFFGRARRMGERPELPRVQVLAFVLEPGLHDVGEREVHVVASEQDVVANGDALERECTIAIADFDEREVGRASADVDDEDDVSHRHIVAPGVATLSDPVVQRSLRLFEQDRRFFEASEFGRFDRQLASDRIERSRHGEDDLLFFERVVGVRQVPGGSQVRQVARGGLQRRHPWHIVGLGVGRGG